MADHSHIKIDDLRDAVIKELQAFAGATDQVVADATEKTAKRAVQRLKATSPIERPDGGEYAKSWKQEDIKAGYKKHIRVIHAGNGQYRLTHLLEKGHNVRNKPNGPIIGHAPAYPHIAEAEEYAIAELYLEIRKGVEGIKI